MKEKQVFKNANWIIVCRLAQSVFQLVIGMLSARYLGPSNYGLINYAASIVAFALPLMKLGMNAILVYELVDSPSSEGEIMGTSLAMNLVSGIVCMFGVVGFTMTVDYGETETILVCSLYSLSLIFAAIEMIQYWFQYKLLSKFSSVVMLIAYMVVSVYKTFLLITEKSVYWFAVSHAIEYGLIGTALLVLYFKNEGQRFSFSINRAKKMLDRSKHYILSALMVVVIQNTDHIMITSMISEAENGLYSAAITCATVVQFVYIAIVDSFRPLILSQKKEKNGAYENNVSRLYGITLYMALAQAVVFFIFADIMVSVLYGSEYAGSATILRVLVFYFVFSVMGTVRNVWVLAEEKQKYLWIINLSGALFNVILNAFMIPVWGAIGAAAASLFTQCFANFILGFIVKPLRENNRLMLIGLNPGYFFSEIKEIVRDFLISKENLDRGN